LTQVPVAQSALSPPSHVPPQPTLSAQLLPTQVRLSPLVSQQLLLLLQLAVQAEPLHRLPPQLVLPPPLEHEPLPLHVLASVLVQPLAHVALWHTVLELKLEYVHPPAAQK
jgi:hypothetical protein